MNRRNVLLGMGTVAAGTGAVFGSGAFTQVESERDLTIGIDDDSSALIGIKAGANVASVYESDSGDTAGELVIDTDELSGGDEGFAVGSTVDIGDIENGDVADGGEAFTVTNNFDDVGGGTGDIDIAIDLTGIDLGEVSGLSSLEFYGTGPNETQVTSAGGRRVYNVSTDETIDFAIRFTTASTTGPKGLDAATVTFQAGSDLTSDDFPATQPADTVTRSSDGAEFSTIQGAVDDSRTTSGETLRVGAGTFDESVTIDVEGLTLEGPNAGIAGDSDQRGDEATITSGVFVDGNPSDVVIDGLAIERTIGEAEGVVQIGSTSNPGANNLTIRNNVITATSNGPSNLGTILIEQIDGEIQIEDNLLTQTGDGTGSAQVRGLVEAVQLANTTIVVDGNTIETDFGVRPSGFDGPSPEYTITNNEFVENDRVGVQLGGDYSGKVEISGNTFEDSNIGIDHATGATTDITIESNTFTETEGADIVAFVSDRRGGDGSVVGLNRDAIEANNTFNPGSTQVGPIDFAGEQLFDIVPADS